MSKITSNNTYIYFTVDAIENYMIDLKNKRSFLNIIELFELNAKNYEKMVLKELKSEKWRHK